MVNVFNNLVSPYLLSLLVATGIGLIIGLEREFSHQPEKGTIGGIRTFPLSSILGCITTYATRELTDSWLLVSVTFGFIIFVATTYYIRSVSGHTGITTEVSLFIAYLLGVMTALSLFKEALAAAVVTTTLLSLKGQFHSFVARLTEDELFAFIKFIILCMLLFPFLPDAKYGPNGLLNPREIGLIVVIVSSLSFTGYLLMKFTGADRGIYLTSILGGLFSSTAVTWIFSARSKQDNASLSSPYAAGIVLASSIMFLRVALLAFIFSTSVFLSLVTPCLLMAAMGGIFVFIIGRKHKTDTSAPVELRNPVHILSAVGFAVLYISISLLVFYMNDFLGHQGLLISGFLAGLADTDAITISMTKFGTTNAEFSFAATVILVAMVSNTLVKAGISVARGTAEVKKKVAYALGAMSVAGLVFILLRILVPALQ